MFLDQVFLLKQKLTIFQVLVTLSKSLFPGISYLGIIRNVSTFRIYKSFSFHLTRRPYPKFYEMSTMGCVTKSPVANILRSG